MIEHLTHMRLIKIRQQGSLLRNNVVYFISPFKQLLLGCIFISQNPGNHINRE